MTETRQGSVAQEEQSTAASLDSQPPRRSPRKTASIPVWLRREAHARTWEEETETQILSRHGAGLQCRHAIESGASLVVVRKDTGQRASVRVSYCRYTADGSREIGIEFLNCDNFWGLDWNSPEQDVSRPETLRKPSPPCGEESVPADSQAPKIVRMRRRPIRLDKVLMNQERQLWEAIHAKNTSVLKSLLAADFIWITPDGAHGKHHDLQRLSDWNSAERSPENFRMTRLNNGAVMVTFQAVEAGADHAETSGSQPDYHSSVWVRRGERWEMLFHQQTLGMLPGQEAGYILRSMQTEARDPDRSAQETAVLLWRGADPVVYTAMLAALAEARIPFYVYFPHDYENVLSSSSAPRASYGVPNYDVRVTERDLPAAQAILAKILAPASEAVPENVLQESEELPVQELPLKWDLETATVEAWSGRDQALSQFLADTLRENGIPSRREGDPSVGFRVLVRPQDEARARGIVREIVEG